MLDDHSGSESPAQIDVLQQLSFVLLQSRDIQQAIKVHDDVIS